MTGNALIGASQGDALEVDITVDNALADAFSEAMEVADRDIVAEEADETAETSADFAFAAMPVPAPVTPTPTRLVMDLPLTEADADAMMAETVEAPSHPFIAPAEDAAPIEKAANSENSADAADVASTPEPSPVREGSIAPVLAPAPILALAPAPAPVSETTRTQTEAETPQAGTEAPQPAPRTEPPAQAAVEELPQAAAQPDTPVRADLPERLRNVPQKVIEIPAAEAPAQDPAQDVEQPPVEATAPLDDFTRDVEVTAERLAARPSSLPAPTVTPLPVEPAKKYAADGRVAAHPVATSGLDAAPEAADAATPVAASAPQADVAPEANAKTSDASAKVTFDPLMAAATSHADGDVVEVEQQPLEQQRPAEAANNDTKGSLLSQATLRTTAELAAAMITRLGHRTTRFDMVLTPETLGNVEVTIEVGADGQMSARMAFDTPQAANEMRARAEELRRQLAESGFDVAENALEFTDRENDQRGGFNQFLSDGRSGRRAFIGAARLAELADTPVVPVWTPQPHARTGVDMKV